MRPNITIIVKGAKNTAKTLKHLRSDFKNTTVPLDRSSKKYLNVISANFKDKGQTFGDLWPPLSKVTIRIKRALRKEGKSIAVQRPLVRTGLMKKSFGYEILGLNISKIFNAQEYAKIHQESGYVLFKGRKVKVPKRVLAAIDDTRINMVGQIFKDWVKELINKYQLGV